MQRRSCTIVQGWQIFKYGEWILFLVHLIVSALDFRSSGLGSSSGWGHGCIVFLFAAKHFTLKLPLFKHMFISVPANLMLGEAGWELKYS